MAMRMRFNALKTRLIIVLLLLVILPTVTIGWIAHSMMFENIQSNRIKAVGRNADAKHDQLVMVLTRANIRAEHFLSDLSDQCRFNSAKPDHLCAASLIRSYLAAEGAIGATMHRKGSDSLTIGTSATPNEETFTFKTGQLARFSGTGPDNNHSYFVSAAEESTGLQLAITYPSSILEPVFNPPPADLGLSGETFLADGEGFFVTKPRYHSTQGHSHPISARPMQSCMSGQSREVIDLDYRDIVTVMGFRFVPEFGSACIMAHITQDEAFAPLKLLEQRLFLAVFLFGVILIITIMYLARNIVKPITNLTRVARAITAGDYQAQAEIAGSDEVSELANSFNFMTNRLVQSEKILNEAQQLAHIGSWEHDLVTNSLTCSKEIFRILEIDLTHKNISYEAFILTVHPEDREMVDHANMTCIQTREQCDIVHRLLLPDGRVKWVNKHVTFYYDSNGEPLRSLGTIQDITERKRVEQQLRDLTAHLQTVRENEKVSIAREIHDDLGGTLTALKMETHQLKTELSHDKNAMPLLEHVESMSQLINTATGITRRIISNLRPTILDDLGLLAALEWQAAQFHKHTGIECRVNCVYDKSEDCAKELDKQRSIALFRISQEALTNVARHSGASRVEIEFHHSDEEAVLSISDNGRGLSEDQAFKSGSYGMLGMRERADQLGGTIRFDIPPGGGLTVTVILPLPANQEGKI